MNRIHNIILTGLAPAIWGSSYLVITELLPDGFSLTSAAIRALPAGLLLLMLSPRLPTGHWWWKVLVLGALNFSIFWWLLFVAAYRLPGGVAAVLGAMQPLIVVFASYFILQTKVRVIAIIASLLGLFGVAMLLLTVDAGFDSIGILAGFGGALSMALGVVLSRKWQPPVQLATFTAWQLIAGGILLLPFAIIAEPNFPALTSNSLMGYLYLSIIGGAFTYILWFRGLRILGPNTISPLGFLSPLCAVILGWAVLDQRLEPLQILGIVIVLTSIWLATRAPKNLT